jgi:eukaryotic-like serine/threonine-protein kinase
MTISHCIATITPSSQDVTLVERATPERRSRTDALGIACGEEIRGTPYVALRLIGQGGMGEIYEAEHRHLGRRCVLKVLHRSHRGRVDLAARMRDEARSLAMLRHPNLVDVFDLGTAPDGRPFFVMDLLRGRDLRAELLKRRVIEVPAALELIAQALEGLESVHAAGIVHRDVKLENLFLCEDGTLKLLDFGIAKIMGSTLGHTERGVAIGTPRSMAPEQCVLAEVDARTDVYAAGLALFELIAGEGPFDELRGDAEALRFAHCARTPPPPSRIAPQPIDAAVDAVVLRAIAKVPADRFQSAREMGAALRALLEDPGRRPAAPAGYPHFAPTRRRAAWAPSPIAEPTSAQRSMCLRSSPPHTMTPVVVDDAPTEVMPVPMESPKSRRKGSNLRVLFAAIAALAALGVVIAVVIALGVRAQDPAPPAGGGERAAPREAHEKQRGARRLGPRRSAAKADPMGCKMIYDDAFFSRDDDRTPRRKP